MVNLWLGRRKRMEVKQQTSSPLEKLSWPIHSTHSGSWRQKEAHEQDEKEDR